MVEIKSFEERKKELIELGNKLLEKGDRVVIAGGSYILPTRKGSKTIGGIVEI